VRFGSVYKETSPSFSIDPEYRLDGKFPIDKFSNELVIQVLDRQRDQNTYDPIQHGSTTLTLDVLPFFQKRNVTYRLYKEQELLNSEVVITCFLEINNNTDAINFLNSKIIELSSKYETNMEDRRMIEEQLNGLRAPFLG
jgi:hypothetical protein